MKEFLPKLTEQITFVKENGKYVNKCNYPELPPGFVWGMGITVKTKDDDATYGTKTRIKEHLIPDTGSFTKEVPFVNDGDDVTLYRITAGVYPIDISRLIGGMNGLFTLTKTSESNEGIRRAAYDPPSGANEYYEDFDFDRMFQW